MFLEMSVTASEKKISSSMITILMSGSKEPTHGEERVQKQLANVVGDDVQKMRSYFVQEFDFLGFFGSVQPALDAGGVVRICAKLVQCQSFGVADLTPHSFQSFLGLSLAVRHFDSLGADSPDSLCCLVTCVFDFTEFVLGPVPTEVSFGRCTMSLSWLDFSWWILVNWNGLQNC